MFLTTFLQKRDCKHRWKDIVIETMILEVYRYIGG